MEEGWCLSAQRIDRLAVDSLGLFLGCWGVSLPHLLDHRGGQQRGACVFAQKPFA